MKVIQIRDNIIDVVTGFKPSEDFDLPPSEVLTWMTMTRAFLFKRETQNVYYIDDQWITKYDCQVITLDKAYCVSGKVHTNYVIELPFSPLSGVGNLGILNVGTYCGMDFKRFQAGETSIFKHLRWAKPSQRMPYWYMASNKLYLIAPGRDLTKCDFFIDAVGVPNYSECDCDSEMLESEFPLPDTLLNELTDICVKIAYTGLKVIQDTSTDGKQN